MEFIKSLRHAAQGVLLVLKSESNARTHLILAVIALAAGLYLNITNAELAGLFFAIILVFLAEIVNTTIEKTLDLIDTKTRPEIKAIKDMAAGAVLVAAVGAALIGAAIFAPYILEVVWRRG